MGEWLLLSTCLGRPKIERNKQDMGLRGEWNNGWFRPILLLLQNKLGNTTYRRRAPQELEYIREDADRQRTAHSVRAECEVLFQ